MKKISLIIMVVTTLFTSCNTNNGKNPFSKLGSNLEENNDIITYYNNVLEAYKTYNNSYITKGINYFDKAEEFITKKIAGVPTIKPIKPIHVIIAPHKKIDSAPKGFTDKQELIQNAFQEIRRSANVMYELIDEITLYLDAEDYFDDKGKKLQDNKAKATIQVEHFNANAKILFEAMSPIVQQAEENILEDHPLKEHIISAKKIIAQVDNFISEVELQAQNDIINQEKLQSLYNELENLSSKSQKLTIKDDNFAKKKSSFNYFNQSIESFLGPARTLMRNSSNTNEFSERDYQEVSSYYNQIINSYNTFVD